MITTECLEVKEEDAEHFPWQLFDADGDDDGELATAVMRRALKSQLGWLATN